MPTDPSRCPWCLISPLMLDYHDREWGVPVHNDQLLFEHLVLDGFQAGLSWAVVLKKREAFRRAFGGFHPEKVARYTSRSVERLLRDPGIIRNRQKVEAAIKNAKALLAVQEDVGTFDQFIWQFVDGTPRQNRWRTDKQIPARTRQSDEMSAALKARGFSFVGSTICYAFMQAAGLVNDHLVTCHRWKEVAGMATRLT